MCKCVGNDELLVIIRESTTVLTSEWLGKEECMGGGTRWYDVSVEPGGSWPVRSLDCELALC